ncbi:type IV pillus assembly protein [Paraburkholderia terrae]|uniref:Type IV pillus assembly protein n=2 Tax=Paraburkholderia terrae TaxID=311230 RepID=A0A2I8EL80_9BURK|nr:type IV pillus assembly protein [Paraburkholderia terrae]
MRRDGVFPVKSLALFTRVSSRRADFGHTLLEMTIAIALGLFVTAGAVSLYRSQRIAFAQAVDAAQIHDAGMTALTLIGEQLQMAGFVPADMPRTFPARPGLFGCSGGRPIGADDSLTCESLATHSDGVAVRYVADNVSTWPSIAGLATDCLGQGVAKTDADAPGVSVVNRFYAKTSGSTGEPELYCEGTGKANSSQPLVEGVERVRLRYWLAGASSAMDAAQLLPAQWANVVAVDVCVLVRGAPQALQSRYVDCDGVSALSADARVRRAFWRRVAIRNNEGSAA